MPSDNDSGKMECNIGLNPIKMGEMIQKVNSIYDTVKVIKGDNKKDHEQINNKIDKQNGRVRALENWRFWALGIGVATVFFLGLAIRLDWLG